MYGLDDIRRTLDESNIVTDLFGEIFSELINDFLPKEQYCD
jgi:hypothetical protein